METDHSELPVGEAYHPEATFEDVNPAWAHACANEECTLHQISPYIGKLKSVIARDLIHRYSSPGDLVLDPFAGSFTIPLEAKLTGRHAFGTDISPYAFVLGMAKLSPPNSLADATQRAHQLLTHAARRNDPDLRSVPAWVRAFFHPQTLKEAIKFADLCLDRQEYFFLACLLGILHHQRPGFLSYPSSHLVPYLRDKKFPRKEYPEMYVYRDLATRLHKKIERVFKRVPAFSSLTATALQQDINTVVIPDKIHCIITSPPYMNALDYGRDNRLRLWFIDRARASSVDQAGLKWRKGFVDLMTVLAHQASRKLAPYGHCVVIMGDQSERGYKGSPAQELLSVFQLHAPNLRLTRTTIDEIPDIRRSRRDCHGIRAEHFLVFQKVCHA